MDAPAQSPDSTQSLPLACPRCDQPLHDLTCSACRVTFPRLGNIPWLFAEPEYVLADWRNRWHFAESQLHTQADQAASAAESAGSPATKQRLQQMADAWRGQGAALRDFLAPLALSPEFAKETHLALKTRLPTHHGVDAYTTHVVRDWCWGDAENQASSVDVSKALEAAHTDCRQATAVVLGSGAGRLAYDLHETCGFGATAAVDLNPLLLLIAQRMSHGGTGRFWEFPTAPRTSGDCAVEHMISAPAPARQGLQQIGADIARLPFQAQSADVVITPWLIDVVDMPFNTLCARINRILKPGACWVIHGSLAFRSTDPARQLTRDEVLEVLEATGFKAVFAEDSTVPYLQSPHARMRREEQVVTIAATKTGEADLPPRGQHLPDWLVTGRIPVPRSKLIERQLLTSRVQAFIMSMIDGKRTLKDIAAEMERQRLMPAADAETAVRGFLIRLEEESDGYQGFTRL